MFKDRTGKNLSTNEAVKKIIIRLFNYLLDFELLLLRMVGHIPSHIVRNSIYRMAGMKIGKGSTVHMWASFFQPKNISIGEDSIIGDHAFLDGRARIAIGDHTDIASHVLIYNSEHDINHPDFNALEDKVEIGDYCFIGPRAIILPGVTIGKGAVVAAGAVVTRDIDEFQIVGGVPAEKIGERRLKDPKYRLGRARLFQ